MELFHELFLTVAITVIFSFALSKIFLLAAGGGVKEDAPLGSCKDGESERGGRFVGGGLRLEECEGESVVGKLEVRAVLNDVDGDVGLEKRLVEGGCGEKTVEVLGIAADLVEECVEGEGSWERREAAEDGVAVGLDKRLIEGGCGDNTVEVEECVDDGASSEKREAVEDGVAFGLEKRLMEGGYGEKTAEVGEKTAEVGEIAADLIAECVEDEGSSEKRDGVEADVAVGFDIRLMERGSGEKTAEVGEIAADLVEECVEDDGSSEKKEAVEDDLAEKKLMEEGCGEKKVEACDGVGGVEAHLIEGYAEDEGKEQVEEVTVVGLEERLMKGDCGEETVEVANGISEVAADLVGDEECSEKIEKFVELEETSMKGDCGEQTVEDGDGANKVEAISVHECVDQERNSEKSEAVDCVECEVKDEVGHEREDLSDDDWEGIQRTDLDRAFGAAAAFVSSEKNANHILNLSSDVKIQLSGLYKVATEGPCQEPPPMALKISARAKWNAWQRLGNMSPEAAMEQYVALLSRDIPGWLVDDPHEHQGS